MEVLSEWREGEERALGVWEAKKGGKASKMVEKGVQKKEQIGANNG